jgi:hypothetical protein
MADRRVLWHAVPAEKTEDPVSWFEAGIGARLGPGFATLALQPATRPTTSGAEQRFPAPVARRGA